MTGKSEQDMDQSNERDLGLTVATLEDVATRLWQFQKLI